MRLASLKWWLASLWSSNLFLVLLTFIWYSSCYIIDYLFTSEVWNPLTKNANPGIPPMAKNTKTTSVWYSKPIESVWVILHAVTNRRITPKIRSSFFMMYSRNIVRAYGHIKGLLWYYVSYIKDYSAFALVTEVR